MLRTCLLIAALAGAGCYARAASSVASPVQAELGCGPDCPKLSDPNAPAVSCYDLDALIKRSAAGCSLELLNGCDTSEADAPNRKPGDCPDCDEHDRQRLEYKNAKCDEPRVVQ